MPPWEKLQKISFEKFREDFSHSFISEWEEFTGSNFFEFPLVDKAQFEQVNLKMFSQVLKYVL